MATTAKPIDFLVSGVRDTTGAVVASGKVRWYNPGTLVAAVAYSDAACTTPITAPLTLNAGGQGTIYCLEPVRVIVKDSTETITYYDDIAALQRHDSVYVTSSGINGGVETTLEAVLSTATTALGAGFQYKESSGATARNYVDWLGQLVVSVMDFAAVGDGSTDDTVAIQAASDRVEARGGGWVYFPKGTYKITSAISIDTVGVSWMGAGRGISVIKNAGTTTATLSINVGSAIDSKIIIKDLSITASTTSSGAAITVANGDRIRLENVMVALHRSGIVLSAVSDAQVIGCGVESTDDNAAAIGINVGTRGRVDNCRLISGTTNGTGITLASDARALDCYIEKFATGVTMTGSGAQARACTSALATTSFSMGAARTLADSCFASGAATGFTIGAFASCGVPGCTASACTTDLTVTAGATLVNTQGSQFTGTITNSQTSPVVLPLRTFFSSATSGSATPTFTPDISGGKNVNVIACTAGGAPTALTIAAHATATLAVGDIMVLVIQDTDASFVTNVTWNAQYKDPDGATAFSSVSGFSVTGQTWRAVAFQWNGTNFVAIWVSASTVL
jgi:hypothetical protein